MKSNIIDKILFKKDYASMTYKEKAVYHRRWFFHLYGIIVFLGIGVIILSLHMLALSYPFPTNLEIKYNGLTLEEQHHAEEILSDLKPQYLNLQREIVITTNLEPYYNQLFMSEETKQKKLNVLLGFNENGQGKVYVLYNDNDYELKRTICHELLHTYFYVNDDAHKIVYDVADYLPCFKNNTLERK